LLYDEKSMIFKPRAESIRSFLVTKKKEQVVYAVKKTISPRVAYAEFHARLKKGAKGPKACAALRRPENYWELHPQRQREIDTRLGIHDWTGNLNE
jgi:hypothetical protein